MACRISYVCNWNEDENMLKSKKQHPNKHKWEKDCNNWCCPYCREEGEEIGYKKALKDELKFLERWNKNYRLPLLVQNRIKKLNAELQKEKGK